MHFRGNSRDSNRIKLGCAFCIDMHTKEARKNGETEQYIYTLNAWRDTSFFSEEEQAILAIITINAWNRIGITTKLDAGRPGGVVYI